MKIKSKDFRVEEGEKVDLKKWSTLVKPAYKSKKEYKKFLALRARPTRMYLQMGPIMMKEGPLAAGLGVENLNGRYDQTVEAW